MNENISQATIARTLTEYGKCSLALNSLLLQDADLSEMDGLFIENQMQVVHMGFVQWQARQRRHLK